MGKDMVIGNKIQASIIKVKGHCSVNHMVGESFEISCYKSGGLCGFFFNNIFSNLQTFQFGGKMPWWQGDVIELNCPDPHNTVTMRLERSKIQ